MSVPNLPIYDFNVSGEHLVNFCIRIATLADNSGPLIWYIYSMNMKILDLDGQIEATFILPPLLAGIPQSQVPEDIKCESLVFEVHQW